MTDEAQTTVDMIGLLDAWSAWVRSGRPVYFYGCRFESQSGGGVIRTAGKLAKTISVKDFGAVGDGLVDDSAAFQAALDGHAAVYVPAGDYRLDTEIQVKPR